MQFEFNREPAGAAMITVEDYPEQFFVGEGQHLGKYMVMHLTAPDPRAVIVRAYPSSREVVDPSPQ
jgi:hypothetical protein